MSNFFLKKSYKNAFFGISFSSYFSMYLQKYFTYKNVLYLKRILKRFCFGHFNCNFALTGTVWAVEIKTCVHFFLGHPLLKYIQSWREFSLVWFFTNLFINRKALNHVQIFNIVAIRLQQMTRCHNGQILLKS